VLNLKSKKRRNRSETVLFCPVKEIDLFSGFLLIEINSAQEEEGTMIKPVKGYRKVFMRVMAFLKNDLFILTNEGSYENYQSIIINRFCHFYLGGL
jgi:hypothetical protein